MITLDRPCKRPSTTNALCPGKWLEKMNSEGQAPVLKQAFGCNDGNTLESGKCMERHGGQITLLWVLDLPLLSLPSLNRSF